MFLFNKLDWCVLQERSPNMKNPISNNSFSPKILLWRKLFVAFHCKSPINITIRPFPIYRGESQSLVQLLHACDDNTDLLVRKDKEYAQHIANTPSDERPGTTSHPPTYSGTQYARQMEYNTSYTIETRGGGMGGNVTGFEQLYNSLYSNTNDQENTDLPLLTMEEVKWVLMNSFNIYSPAIANSYLDTCPISLLSSPWIIFFAEWCWSELHPKRSLRNGIGVCSWSNQASSNYIVIRSTSK